MSSTMKIFAADIWVSELEGAAEEQIGKPLSSEHPDALCVSCVFEETVSTTPLPAELYPSPKPFVPGTPPATIAQLSPPLPGTALAAAASPGAAAQGTPPMYGTNPPQGAAQGGQPAAPQAPTKPGRWRLRYKGAPPKVKNGSKAESKAPESGLEQKRKGT